MIRLFLPLYLLLALALLLFQPGLDPLTDALAEDARAEDAVADFEGAFFMAETLLLQTPPAQWPDLLARMSSRNIPVWLADRTDFSLTQAQQQSLDDNRIVVLEQGDGILLKQLPGNNILFGFGPVATLDDLVSGESLAAFLWVLLVLTLVAVWAWQIQRRITHLGRITHKLGNGDLAVRADLDPSRALGHLNQDFNQMADQLEQLIESHKLLTNAVSHELRTPISRIRFELEFAQHQQQQEPYDPESVRASFDSIAEDTQELEKLVSELLGYARFERQSQQLSLTPLETGPWLQDWFDDFMRQRQGMLPASAAELDVQCRVEATADRILADPTALQRAIDNLVLNAARYARSRIRVSLLPDTSAPGQWLQLLVEDDGPGIPVNQRQQLFDPFVRGDPSRSRDTGGYGLGLAIVRRIVIGHHGSVDIGDSEWGGACLAIRLPLRPN